MRVLQLSGRLCPDGTREPDTEWVPKEDYDKLRDAARAVVVELTRLTEFTGKFDMYARLKEIRDALRDALGEGR